MCISLLTDISDSLYDGGMLLIDYLKQQEHGAQSALAKTLGVTQTQISHWANGLRPVPAEHAAQIEIATGGVVTRKELRPHDWERIWPAALSSPPASPISGETLTSRIASDFLKAAE